MRSLRQPKLLAVSVPLGAVLAVACVPLILVEGAGGPGRWLQGLALPALCALTLQAALAWTPTPARLLPGRGCDHPVRRWVELLLLALAMAGFRLLTDLWLQRVLVLPQVTDWPAFGRMLPFTGLVQPLFLVLGVHAFAVRLGGRPQRGLVAVLLAHQGIVLLQFGSLARSSVLVVLLTLAGLQGLIMGTAYLRYGPAGPAALSVIGFGRHAAYLLFPVLRGTALG